LDSSLRIESLGACLSAHADAVACGGLVVVEQLANALSGLLVARIHNPPIRLHQHCGAEEVVRVPPVHRARSLAGCTHNALIEPIQFGPVRNALYLLGLGLLRVLLVSDAVLALQIWSDIPLLVIEVRHVHNQVFDGLRAGQGGHVLRFYVGVDFAKAGQCVFAVDIHGAAAADAFSARPAECERGVDFVFDFD